jgi:hypothetical protein
MTGQQRPSAGQTLADSGVTLTDRLLRAGGSLDTLGTMISFGRTYDALVREAAATHGGPDDPDAGIDAGSDAAGPDAGHDIDDDTVSGGRIRYEGEATLYGDGMELEEGCIGTPRVELQVTVTNFDGNGSSTEPYLGNVSVQGTVIVTAARCGGSLGLAAVTGRIGGRQGEVGFDLESGVPPRYQVTLSRGLVEVPQRTLTGDISVEFWPEGRFLFGVDGVIELSEVDE